MAKKKKGELGVFFYYEWFEDLMLLEVCDRGAAVYALYRYITEGEPMKDSLRGELALFAAMLEGKVGAELQKIREKKERKEKRKNGEKTEKESSKERVKREDKRKKVKKDKTEKRTNECSSMKARARESCEVIFEENGESVTYGDFLKNVLDYFSVNCYVSDPRQFIAYNERRGWLGFYGENVMLKLESYADNWEKGERLRRGMSLKGIKTFDEYDRRYCAREERGIACTLPWVDFDAYG